MSNLNPFLLLDVAKECIGNSPIAILLIIFTYLLVLISERFSIFSSYTSLNELISSALSEGDLTERRAYDDGIKIVF